MMEYRPNSKSDISSRAELTILSLTEHYVLNRALNQWNGRKYVQYGAKEARLRSFIINDWPQVLQART
jgi:hypothetical protein